MDRREFLRGGLVAGFAALLATLGLDKAEEPDTIHVHFTEEEEVFRYCWNPAAFVKLGTDVRQPERSADEMDQYNWADE